MSKKGRNAELIERRNKKLKERFNYLYNEKRMRYDDVIKKLSLDEFFISESTIDRILVEHIKNKRSPNSTIKN